MIQQIAKKIKKNGIDHSILRAAGIAIHSPTSAIYKKLLGKTAKIHQNQILFYSIPGFSDNAKALYNYIQKRFPGQYKMVWIINKEDSLPEGNYPDTVFIRANSYYHRGFNFKALKAVAQSRYILFTHASPVKEIPKMAGQIAVNLWHGCGYKAKEKTEESGISINPFDYVLVPGKIFVQTKAEFWNCSPEIILPLGYPRYDLLLAKCPKAEAYSQRMRGDADKLIFWMPTFRQTGRDKYPEEQIRYNFEIPLLSSEEELGKLNDYCKANRVTLCLKRHPMQVVYSSEKNHYSNIRFISNKDIMEADVEFYSLLGCADALISDYSSVSIDYLLVNRPIAFALEDFEKYKSVRGFVFDDPLHYMPGHHLYNFHDLCDFISDVQSGDDRYAADRRRIMEEVHTSCNNYCENIWKTITKLANNGEKTYD